MGRRNPVRKDKTKRKNARISSLNVAAATERAKEVKYTRFAKPCKDCEEDFWVTPAEQRNCAKKGWDLATIKRCYQCKAFRKAERSRPPSVDPEPATSRGEDEIVRPSVRSMSSERDAPTSEQELDEKVPDHADEVESERGTSSGEEADEELDEKVPDCDESATGVAGKEASVSAASSSVAATTATKLDKKELGDAQPVKSDKKATQPVKYHFHMISYPAVQLAEDPRPGSRAYGLEPLGSSVTANIRAHLRDLTTEDLNEAADFDAIPAPTELFMKISSMYAQGSFGLSEKRVQVLRASVNRSVNAYYRVARADPKFMRDLNAVAPHIVDVHSYFIRLSAAMEWWAIVEMPRRQGNFSQAVRAANTNTDYLVQFNEWKDTGVVRNVRATAALMRRNPAQTAACCLCVVGTAPAACGTTIGTVLGGCATAVWTSVKAAAVNPLVIGAAALCACSSTPEDFQDEVVQRVKRGVKRVRDQVCGTSEEDSPNEVSHPRPIIGAEDSQPERKGPPASMTMGAGAPELVANHGRQDPEPGARPRKVQRVEDLGGFATSATSTSTGSRTATRATSTSTGGEAKHGAPVGLDLDDAPARAPMIWPNWQRRAPYALPVQWEDMRMPINEASNITLIAYGVRGIYRGLRGGLRRMQQTTLNMGGRDQAQLEYAEIAQESSSDEEDEPMGKEKEKETQHFRMPTHAASAWCRLNENAGPATDYDLDSLSWDILETYGGYTHCDPGFDEVPLSPQAYSTRILLDYKERAGGYQPSSAFAVYVKPAPYRNPDNCPFYYGTTCLLPAPDGQKPGQPLDPKYQLDPAFRGSWKPKEHPKVLKRHEKEEEAVNRAADLYPDVDTKSTTKRWWHTGLLLFDIAVTGYASTPKNLMDGMGRHYGVACTGCSCDANPKGPILDYNARGTCARCQLWNEADDMTRFWSDLLPGLGLEYRESTPRTNPPPPITTLVDKIRAGESIGSYSAADDNFGLVSWYSRLDSRRRRIYGSGIDAYINGDMKTVSAFPMSTFIKWEKQSNPNPNGKNKRLKAPRLVCPSKDPAANLVSGPPFWAISEALKRQTQCWLKGDVNSSAPIITVTSGCNPLQVGDIFGSWLDVDGYSIVVELDFSRLDSTENKNFALVADRVMAKIALKACDIYDEDAFNALFRSMTHRKVFTPFGKFDYLFGLCSGFGGTFHRNTLGVTIAVVGRVLANLKRLWPEGVAGADLESFIRFMGLGDDCLLAFRGVPPAVASQVLSASILDLAAMGLNPSPVAPQIVSFCSALFWPIIVDGRETFVLAPELLRQLSRFGATFNHKFPQCTNTQARALCLGMVKSNPFWQALPVLRVLYFYYIDLEVKADLSQQEWHKTYVETTHTYARSSRVVQFMEIAYGLDAMSTKQLEDELHTALLASDARPCFFSSPLIHTAATHFHKMRDTNVLEQC